jgi:nucleoid-associated protein EbfC
MKGIPNVGNLMKQAQQFQARMAKLQEELGEKTIESSAGGGMVTVVANGKQEILSIKIEPEVIQETLSNKKEGEEIQPSDMEMLQDLIIAAMNEALTRAKNMVNEEMGKLTQGLNLPQIPGLFG